MENEALKIGGGALSLKRAEIHHSSMAQRPQRQRWTIRGDAGGRQMRSDLPGSSPGHVRA
jgi:hypothetical protein